MYFNEIYDIITHPIAIGTHKNSSDRLAVAPFKYETTAAEVKAVM